MSKLRRYHRSRGKKITAKMVTPESLHIGQAVRMSNGYYVKTTQGGLKKVTDRKTILLLNQGDHRIEKGSCKLCGLPADGENRCFHPASPRQWIWTCNTAKKKRQEEARESEEKLRTNIFETALRQWRKLPFWKRWMFWKYPRPLLEQVELPKQEEEEENAESNS
jgi:hypothetical protein